MINQSLLDFIKSQLLRGWTKEKISAELLANGWNPQDIEKGFNTVNAQTPFPAPNPIPAPSIVSVSSSATSSPLIKIPTHAGQKIFLAILALFLAISGVFAYLHRDSLFNLFSIKNLSSKTQDTLVLRNDVETPTEDQTKKVATTQPTKSQQVQNTTQTQQNSFASIPKLDPTQVMFLEPADNTRVKMGDIIKLKIIAGKDIKKIGFLNPLQDRRLDIPINNGVLYIDFEVPMTLTPITLEISGWTGENNLVDWVERVFQGLSFDGMVLRINPYTDYKVIKIHEAPEVIQAQVWETPILEKPLFAEFENNTLGGLLQIPYSDISFKIEDESVIKLIKRGPVYNMQGVKFGGETYLNISYGGISKRIPMYVPK